MFTVIYAKLEKWVVRLFYNHIKDFHFLPNINNMEEGGIGLKGSMIRVGRMIEAEKTTYKHQTDENGKITYPKIAGNESRIKGQMVKTIQ